jgi:putative transposase
MARLPRLALAGFVHHVVQQGHNGQPVFLQDLDRLDYLAMLQEAARTQQVAIHAYALLDHAVHLLATPAQPEGLGRLMQALGRRYVSAFNRRHGRTGTLWNGRFRSSLIAPALLVPATVAIEGGAPGEGRQWTSAPHHLGRQRSALITEHPAYWVLGNTPFERELAHANLLKEGAAPALVEQMTAAIRSSGVVGDAAFRAEVAGLTGRPAQTRQRGRPARRQDGKKTVPI